MLQDSNITQLVSVYTGSVVAEIMKEIGILDTNMNLHMIMTDAALLERQKKEIEELRYKLKKQPVHLISVMSCLR